MMSPDGLLSARAVAASAIRTKVSTRSPHNSRLQRAPAAQARLGAAEPLGR